jgi:hypothetical protein
LRILAAGQKDQDEAEFNRLQSEIKTAEQLRAHAKAALESEAKQREIEENTEISEEVKKNLLNQHKMNMSNYNRALTNEKSRQTDQLAAALAEKKKKQKLKESKLAAQQTKEKLSLKEKLAAEAAKSREIQQKEVEKQQQIWKQRAAQHAEEESKASAAAELEEKKGGEISPRAAVTARGEAVGQGVGLATMSAEKAAAAALAEAQDRINLIQTMAKLEGSVNKLALDQVAYRDQAYVDSKDATDPTYAADAKISSADDITICSANELDTRSLVLYRFGVSLIKLLHNFNFIETPANATKALPVTTPIQLLIAKSLPNNPHQLVAFKNSFHWCAHKNTLFIRKQRLAEAGEFILVLLHCVSHITAEAKLLNNKPSKSEAKESPAATAAWDDRSKIFVESFHRCLKLICGDLFYQSSSKIRHVNTEIDEKSNVPVESLGVSVREAALDELIELHPAGSAHGSLISGATSVTDFENYKLLERLNEYQAFQAEAKLRTHLIELERAATQRETARQIKEGKSFRLKTQRRVENVNAANASAEMNEDRSWLELPDNSEENLASGLDDLADQLNSSLTEVVSQLYNCSANLNALEGKRVEASTQPGAANNTNLGVIETDIEKERLNLQNLSKDKDRIIARLRNIQTAKEELH